MEPHPTRPIFAVKSQFVALEIIIYLAKLYVGIPVFRLW
jgi:hypothetical protein